MGVFAITATQAVLAAGARASKLRAHRAVRMTMNPAIDGAHPILALDHQSVATPLYLPTPSDEGEYHTLTRWLTAHGPAPLSYQRAMTGDEMRCAQGGALARRRTTAGSMLDLADAALRSQRLAILALHPHDPDAMGLHITLFGVEALTLDALVQDYALAPESLDLWRYAAQAQGALLYFLVGGVEEAFTQCSQNLFVKRRLPAEGGPRRAQWPNAWAPSQPLEQLIGRQFEILQASVSASGLPSVSPRNGAIGTAGFVACDNSRTLVLVPYFAGNAVHGHAAKLWSNPNGALMIWDDHSALCAVTISGPACVLSHAYVVRRFPDIAARIASRKRRNGAPADDPEYWFGQEVAEIIIQDEPIAANVLDPARPVCSIHAAGPAMHGKKPAYFASDSLPPYDMALQREREHPGRPRDPSGAAHQYWERESATALAARLAHLARVRAS
jgi:hypothetical protein